MDIKHAQVPFRKMAPDRIELGLELGMGLGRGGRRANASVLRSLKRFFLMPILKTIEFLSFLFKEHAHSEALNELFYELCGKHIVISFRRHRRKKK